MKHSRITSSQEKYIERVANPKTPADFVLALQNPHSTVFKEFMNQLMLGEAIHLITDRMLDRLAEENYLASQKEKEAIYRDFIARELAEQEKASLAIPPKVSANEDELSRLHLDDLKERLDIRSAFIVEIQQQNQHLTDRLDSLHEQSNQQSQEWKTYTHQQSDNFITQLAKNEISLSLTNKTSIAANSPEGRALIAAAFEAPAPAAILDVVGASWQKYNRPIATDANLPPPPPLPPAFANAPLMAGKANFLREIKLIAACAGTDSPKDMIASLHHNAAARRLLPGANLSLKPTPGSKKSLEEGEETTLFSNAIKNYSEKTNVTQLLSQNKRLLAYEEQLQTAEQAIYDKLIEKSLTPKP